MDYVCENGFMCFLQKSEKHLIQAGINAWLEIQCASLGS